LPGGGANVSESGARFARLVEVMRILRGPGGCAWDRRQTLESLRPFVLEEAYEVVEAIDQGDRDALQGEIGDLIFEGVFVAQLCAEEGRFDIADAVADVTEKLIRRHPHVFAPDGSPASPEHALDSSDAVVEQWERLKQKERASSGQRQSILDGISKSLPALLRAFEIGSRAAAVGFDWERAADVVDKIEEEVAELREAVKQNDGVASEEEMGDLFFALANLSRKLGIEPESALRAANNKFSKRFGKLERRLEAKGSSVQDAALEQMEEEWKAVKTEF
jgi:tetrapyrrole methylase family protein/MazG family protein/ATP diphosphatase